MHFSIVWFSQYPAIPSPLNFDLLVNDAWKKVTTYFPKLWVWWWIPWYQWLGIWFPYKVGLVACPSPNWQYIPLIVLAFWGVIYHLLREPDSQPLMVVKNHRLNKSKLKMTKDPSTTLLQDMKVSCFFEWEKYGKLFVTGPRHPNQSVPLAASSASPWTSHSDYIVGPGPSAKKNRWEQKHAWVTNKNRPYFQLYWPSWWFQPIWNILVKLDHFPRKGWT